MDISVIVPTRGRAEKLGRCVRALAGQQLATGRGLTGRFEVIVSVDGHDDDQSEGAALGAWGEGRGREGAGLRVICGERRGINAARNRGLDVAQGRWTLLVNDDLYAQPGMLAEHVAAQVEAIERGIDAETGAIVVGDSPWGVVGDDSLFDRIVRETSIIFFYDRMNEAFATESGAAAAKWKDWGFRHCYTLNLSAATSALRGIGGFCVLPVVYGYDDLEAGWRLQERYGMPVLYRSGAKGTHDHRYTPEEYLARERTLGRAAWHLAGASAGCARAIFGREIRSAEEVAYSRDFVKREATAAERLRGSFLELARTPSWAVAGPAARRLVNLVYEQHLLLKRWEWRKGLLESAEGTAVEAIVAAGLVRGANMNVEPRFEAVGG